jgi:hypothetical protein
VRLQRAGGAEIPAQRRPNGLDHGGRGQRKSVSDIFLVKFSEYSATQSRKLAAGVNCEKRAGVSQRVLKRKSF